MHNSLFKRKPLGRLNINSLAEIHSPILKFPIIVSRELNTWNDPLVSESVTITKSRFISTTTTLPSRDGECIGLPKPLQILSALR